jgi:hypothetical protein
VLTFYGADGARRIALIKEHFVPVVLDGYLRGTPAERAFLTSAGLVNNGFTYLTAGGTPLGGDSYLGPENLDTALRRFRKLPEAERRPPVERAPDADSSDGVAIAPPPGALIANVFFTYLERDKKGGLRRALWHVEGHPGGQGSNEGRNQYLTHVDKLWLKESEWRSLLPANPSIGQTLPLPEAIARRLTRFYAVDLARRSTDDVVRSATFTLTVEDVTATGLNLRLNGHTATGAAFQESGGPPGAEYEFLGYLRYDSGRQRFLRFDVVGFGDGWGGGGTATTNFYRGGEHRRWPMGIAMELVTTDRPVDRIPPQNANKYRAGDAYFSQ